MFKVRIKGRDLKPCARLLEAMSRSGLLIDGVSFDDESDAIVLVVDVPDSVTEPFRNKGFEVTRLD